MTSDSDNLRERILTAMRELADPATGNAPTRRRLMAAGIPTTRIEQLFGNYGAAAAAAGLLLERHNTRLSSTELLRAYGVALRTAGTLPSQAQYIQTLGHSLVAARRAFGSWDGLPAAFRAFATGQTEWADALAILDMAEARSDGPRSRLARSRIGGHVPAGPAYGEPLYFRALRHAPLCESGVIFLFGMLAAELGFLVDVIQPAFPDCEALRRTGHGRWERVRLEFELESRNFAVHGHDPAGCDLLVCWRHNWDACPETLEVLELWSLVRELAR